MRNLDLTLFPEIHKEKWKELAERQLKGGKPDDELSWKNSADISLSGYYDTSDITNLNHLIFFEKLPPHRWKLYEKISVANEANANEDAIEALMGGCDGVIFELGNAPNWQVLLKDIDTSICDIGISSSFEIDKENFSGPIINPYNGNTLEIADSNDPISQIREALSSSHDSQFIRRTALKDFFLEIAFIRALKFLLFENGYNNIQIHSSIPLHQSKEHQWFLNTTSGLASILGGSHSIDLSTAIGDSRISRNIANLIREESSIEKYTDQCGGSYYIEVLTDKIITEVTNKLK